MTDYGTPGNPLNYGAMLDHLVDRYGYGRISARGLMELARKSQDGQFRDGDLLVTCSGTWYAAIPQIGCCGNWADYPAPGTDWQCPGCLSTYHVSDPQDDGGAYGEYLGGQ